jgi:hypothetical protein
MMTNPFKAIPSSYYLPLALLGGGLLAWRMLSGGGSSPSPSSTNMGYDPSLVALGVQTSLERDKLNAQTELGKLAMQTELAMNERETNLASLTHDREINLASAINEREINLQSQLGNKSLDYDNAQKAADYAYMNSALLLDNQINNRIQDNVHKSLVVEHDLGKKGISASKEANRLGFVSNIAKMFF